ncbi:MAG: laccase domain-containing protein [Candidatus Eisenbacteria bacterium]|nr:laccase domain-containing protein [Candidatus Eisenbacteria bacterium]
MEQGSSVLPTARHRQHAPVRSDEVFGLRTRHGISWLTPPPPWPAAVCGGVSCRRGGCSRGALASLNLGSRVGDASVHLRANLAALCRAAGLPLEGAARIRLEHGARVRVVDSGGVAGTGDGLVTRRPGLPLALTVADCVPLLLARPGRGVALAHCGWRGTLAGVAEATAARLCRAARVRPPELFAWIGPGIGACCFRLPRESAQNFDARALGATDGGTTDRRGIAVSLADELRLRLETFGVSPGRVIDSRVCTGCHPELFYSYRRDLGRCGRMLAWILDAGP